MSKLYSCFLEKLSVKQCFFNICINYTHFETAENIMGNCSLENDALTTNKITRTCVYTRKYYEFHQLKCFISIRYMYKHINNSKISTKSIGFKTVITSSYHVSHLKSHTTKPNKKQKKKRYVVFIIFGILSIHIIKNSCTCHFQSYRK